MDKNLPEINVGVVGHIDHGKTTLLSKLTGKFTDTHSEELKRGITIKLGYTEITIYKHNNAFTTKEKIDGKPTTPVRYVSFIDTPGHEMLMATMLSGAAIIDAAILVVAANEGIKPQTREHFIALQAKGIKSLIVVQNKIDLVSKEDALKNYKQIKEFLKGTFAENAPVIPVSTQQEINLDKILEQLAAFEIPKRDMDSNPIFVVARSFDINKPGTDIKNLRGGVLGGILKTGKLRVGDEIEIKPGMNIKRPHGKTEYKTLTTRVLSLQKGASPVTVISPGISLSIETSLDPFLTRADSLTGCMVSLKGKLPEITNKVKINSKLLEEVFGLKEQKKIEPVKTKELLMLSISTTITVGVVENVRHQGFLNTQPPSKEEGNEIELSLNIPVIALKGDKVGIARNIDGHWRLIGWGEII